MTESDVQIQTLEAKGLIRLAALQPELEYLFRHALVQDAAYGSLLKQERRELHGRVGDALESFYPDRRGELAPILAMHFEQAGETDKAIDYFAEAGRHAVEGNAIQEAYAAFDHAARLIGEEPPAAAGETPTTKEEADRRRRREIEVQIGRAQAGYSFRAPEEAIDALEAIVAPAEELGDLELIGQVHMFIALGRLQNGDSATDPVVKRSLDRMREVGEALGDRTLLATPMALVGLTQVFTGPVRTGVATLEEAVPQLEAGKDSIGAAFARGALAMGYANLGASPRPRLRHTMRRRSPTTVATSSRSSTR